MAGALLALPPVAPDLATEHAYVVEYRPLDRCFTAVTAGCKIRTRDVTGYASDTQDDGDPGAYVKQGAGLEKELYFQRGVILRAKTSFVFDLPEASYASELDFEIAAPTADTRFAAEVVVSDLPAMGVPTEIAARRFEGETGTFAPPKANQERRFDHYGKHVRMPLPSRKGRAIRITITNIKASTRLSLGSPLVMRRIDGRGPRQAFLVLHDAVPFYQQEAFLFKGTHDAKADWLRASIAERGIYFPAGQSPGQGTAEFVVRFFRNSYFNAWGWPAMYGKGFDETLPEVLPGSIARLAEQGFVAAFAGNNFTLLPNFSHLGWDVGYQSELKEHPAAMERFVVDLAAERGHDDVVIVWWNSATHYPYPPGRKGAPAVLPDLPKQEHNAKASDNVWRNLLEGADHLRVAYEALRKAAPHATRVTWLGTDHSSGSTQKMAKRVYRVPTTISTGLAHTCGGTAEESNSPFAVLFDEPDGKSRIAPRIVPERVNSFVAWRALEARFGVELGLPRTSTFRTTVFGAPPPGSPDWDDRILVSAGYTGTMRASLGKFSYALFEGKITQKPAWLLTPNEQLVLIGAPTRSRDVKDEELYDDDADPYEYSNLAGEKLEVTLKLRRELTDWMAAHYEDHAHPRHSYKLTFSEPLEVDLFAPNPFTALVDDVPVQSADRRMAHVNAKEVVIVEGADPVGIVELRGAKTSLVLKCSANGLPLDMLAPDRARFNLEVARTNCPLPEALRKTPGPGEVLFSFEPAASRPQAASGPIINARGAGPNDELLAGMKRWGYVRDIDEKKP